MEILNNRLLKEAKKRTPRWEKAGLEDIHRYKEALDVKLRAMDTVNCSNPKSVIMEHMEDIDNNVLDILLAIIEASYCNIPIVGRDERKSNKKKKTIPNWVNEVKPFRSSTIYWHYQWVKE